MGRVGASRLIGDHQWFLQPLLWLDFFFLGQYYCPDLIFQPVHMSSGRSRFKFELAYKEYMGGVVGFTPAQFKAINGFSNLFFGWGGEDDNLHRRTVRTFKGGFRRLSQRFGR